MSQWKVSFHGYNAGGSVWQDGAVVVEAMTKEMAIDEVRRVSLGYASITFEAEEVIPVVEPVVEPVTEEVTEPVVEAPKVEEPPVVDNPKAPIGWPTPTK